MDISGLLRDMPVMPHQELEREQEIAQILASLAERIDEVFARLLPILGSMREHKMPRDQQIQNLRWMQGIVEPFTQQALPQTLQLQDTPIPEHLQRDWAGVLQGIKYLTDLNALIPEKIRSLEKCSSDEETVKQ